MHVRSIFPNPGRTPGSSEVLFSVLLLYCQWGWKDHVRF